MSTRSKVMVSNGSCDRRPVTSSRAGCRPEPDPLRPRSPVPVASEYVPYERGCLLSFLKIFRKIFHLKTPDELAYWRKLSKELYEELGEGMKGADE